LNIEDKYGWTPLHHAVRNNALDSIEFLLDNGVDHVRLNKQQEAPIHLAVIHNQLDALKVLSRIFFINRKENLRIHRIRCDSNVFFHVELV
jgi:ankyrin repeat protein